MFCWSVLGTVELVVQGFAGIDHDAVASRLLRLVEHAVRALEKRNDVELIPGRRKRDAEARGHRATHVCALFNTAALLPGAPTLHA